MPQYSKKEAILNSDLYFDVLERKGVKSIVITRSRTFKELQGKEFDVTTEHTWSKGDSLHKLSQRYYGEFQYWWVIGLMNSKPTDAHYSIGDNIMIPSNPYYVAGLLR